MARQERTTDPLAGITAARRKRFKPLLQTWAAFKDVPAEEVEREVAKSIAEDRAERRAKEACAIGET
ncbi:MAG: hypothetical protein M3442_03930 [Chloroflexota bacterium]|nr:hypothetical protein [Chloroflexota bacterium]